MFWKKLLKIIGIIWCVVFWLAAIVLVASGETVGFIVFAVLGVAGLIPQWTFRKKKLETKVSQQSSESAINEQPALDEQIPRFIQAGFSEAVKANQECRKMLGLTTQDEDLASDFYVEHESELTSLDKDFQEKYVSKDYTRAIAALDQIKAFCLRYGRGGYVHYIEMYEWLHNSKNPCFSYRDLIADESSEAASKGALSALAVFEPQIPENIMELLWFENGPRANYVNSSGKIHYKYGNVDLYIDSAHLVEPSLINISWSISASNDLAEPMGYYPSYRAMTPAQRAKYLYWLTDITQPIDAGYVFVFYYGLERHLLFGEFDKALNAILILRKFHDNRSFQAYSSDAMLLSSIYRQRPDIFELVGIENFSLNVQLAIAAARDKAFAPDLLMRACKAFGFENKRYITGNGDLFRGALEIELTKRFGACAFPIQDNDFNNIRGTFPVVLANYSLMPETRVINFPDIASSSRIQSGVYAVLYAVHEQIKIQLREIRKKQ